MLLANTKFVNKYIPKQKKERYYGNREYKLYLSNEVYNVRKTNTNDNKNDSNDNKNDSNDIKRNTNLTKNDMFDVLYFSDDDNCKDIDVNSQQNDLKLKNININKLNKRSTQLLFRLNEGKGKAIYMIGVDDDGGNKGIDLKLLMYSYEYLQSMCKLVNASCNMMNIYKGLNGYIGSVRIHIPNYNDTCTILDSNLSDSNLSDSNNTNTCEMNNRIGEAIVNDIKFDNLCF